jgi:hypothetical protein
MSDEAEPMTASDDDNILTRYRERFGELPAIVFWHSEMEQLWRLMEQAIKDGRPLTRDDLAHAQGQEGGPGSARRGLLSL